MIQKKKKQLRIIILVLLTIVLMGVGIWGIINTIQSKTNNTENISESKSDVEENKFQLKRLIVSTKLSQEVLEETYSPTNINTELNGEEDEIKIYSLEYDTEEETEKAYEKIKENPDIQDVSPDQIRTTNSAAKKIFYWKFSEGLSISSWGAISMGLDETEAIIDTKTDNPEIVVAVIDSGFDVDHSAIISVNLSSRILNGYNAIDRSTDVTDNDGHGTNVGGIILEGSPDNVKILPIKALDVNEEGKTIGTSASLINAINYAIQNDVDIINMSLGGESLTPQEDTAIIRAYENGITCIVAAGNDGLNLDVDGNDCYPAEHDNVITVGAVRTTLMSLSSTSQLTSFDFFTEEYDTYKNTTANDVTIANFSNYGNCIDFVAPGVLLLGLTAETDQGTIVSQDGTSQATPHITAAAATIKTYNPEYTSDQIEEILAYYAQDLGDEGKDVYYGNGFVSFKDYVECPCGTEGCDGIYCFGCTNAACKYHLGRTNKLSSIEITEQPTKKIYLKNETFDPTGMVVIANYSDGTSAPVTNYTYESSPWISINSDEAGYEVEISYTEDGVTRKATQEVTVLVDKTLTGIAITTPPQKTEYIEGETFDRAGMVVTASYNDGSTAPVTQYTYTPTTALTKDDTKITITYTENEVTETAEQEITVNEVALVKELTAIEITSPPNKTTYNVGEVFVPTGMIITAIYDDGTEQIVTNYTYTPTTALTKNDTKITITYTEGSVTKIAEQSIIVNEVTQEDPTEDPIEDPTEDPTATTKELARISVTKAPNKTSYTAGDIFDPTGMLVTATYSDGTIKNVTDYRYSPTVALRVSDTSITISYTEDGITKTTTTPITVVAASTNDGNTGLLDDPMFEVDVPDGLNTGGTAGGSSSNTPTTDSVTTDQEIPYTGPEETILPIVIVGVSIIMVISFISYRKYKDIR